MSRIIGNLDVQAITGHRGVDINSSTGTDEFKVVMPSDVTLNSTANVTLASTGSGQVSLQSGAGQQVSLLSETTMNNNKIVNLATPTLDTDAATKFYVDSVAEGMSWKDPVQAASNADHPATLDGTFMILTATANGALVLDGFAVSVNDRVLIKDQLDAKQNGIYDVTTVGDGTNPFVLTRSADANTPADLHGATVFVLNGTTWAQTQWTCTFLNSDVIGTNDVNFVEIGAQILYSAGPGLLLAGTQFSVDVAYNFTGAETWTGNHEFSSPTASMLIANSSTTVSATDTLDINMMANSGSAKTMNLVASNIGGGESKINISAPTELKLHSNTNLLKFTELETLMASANTGTLLDAVQKDYQVFSTLTTAGTLVDIVNTALPANSTVLVQVRGVCTDSTDHTDSLAFETEAFFTVGATKIIAQVDFPTISLYKKPSNSASVNLSVTGGGTNIEFGVTNPSGNTQKWRANVHLEIST